jgi:predicted fused transcriptional regulator/phosphomethylpyrimidine kinase
LARCDLGVALAEVVTQFGDRGIEAMRRLTALTPQEFVAALRREGLQPRLPGAPDGRPA